MQYQHLGLSHVIGILLDQGFVTPPTSTHNIACKPLPYVSASLGLLTQFGELVQVTGADVLPMEALAGALLAAVEQSKKSPEAVARWTERGQAVFRQGGKRGKKAESSEAAPGPASSNGAA